MCLISGEGCWYNLINLKKYEFERNSKTFYRNNNIPANDSQNQERETLMSSFNHLKWKRWNQ